MKLMIHSILALLVYTGIASAENNSAKTKLHNDVVFGKGGDVDLKMDLYQPMSGNGPFPAVVVIHGGSWRHGSYEDAYVILLANELAKKGYVGASIQYRLTDVAGFPAQIEDCKCAVRYLRANAKKYNLDPARIGAVGFSAGGHLVCLLGVSDTDDGMEGTGGWSDQSSRVQSVVSFFGPTDFTKKDWAPDKQPVLSAFLGGTYEENPNNYVKASPIKYLSKKREFPPYLFIHGTADDIVGFHQSKWMHEALQKKGCSSKLITMEGEGHGWLGGKLTKSIEQTIEHFDRSLKMPRK